MNHFSLFTGVGGIDLASEWAGFTTVGQCEMADYPYKVLCKHWPDIPKWRDIRDVTNESVRAAGIERIDLISGGFPCQPFSVAGKQRGKEDDRYLWSEMLRVIEELRPTWVLGENVAGIVNMALDQVLSDLESIGYEVQPFVIPASSVNAPHRRDRVFIVAHTRCEYGGPGTEIRKTLRGMSKDRETHCNIKRPSETLQDVANTKSTKCQFTGDTRSRRDGFTNSGEDVANTSSIGQQGQRKLIEPGHKKKSGEWQTSKPVDVCIGEKWSTKPGLGGVFNGIPDWLEQFKWPAGVGQEQFTWEPPRVATGIKNRADRLKCLGNAVNPIQIYPILKAIYEIEAG